MESKSVRTGLLLALVTLLIGVLAGSYATAKTRQSPFGTTQAVEAFNNPWLETGQVSFAEGFAPIVKQPLAAVVNIASSKLVRSRQGPAPFLLDPLFREFFGEQFFREWAVPREWRERSLGSGVIAGPDGHMQRTSKYSSGINGSLKRELLEPTP